MFFFGRILPRKRPLGTFCGTSKLFPLIETVYLYNRTVNIKGESASYRAYSVKLLYNVVDIVKFIVKRNCLKAETLNIIKRLLVGLQVFSVNLLNVKDENVKPSL